MRARMALPQASVAFDALEIVLRDKPADLLALSPKGTVPVLHLPSQLCHIPTVAEYHEAMGNVNKDGAAIYKYLNFDQIEEYVDNAKTVA